MIKKILCITVFAITLSTQINAQNSVGSLFQTAAFDGNFKGIANYTNYYLTLKNANGIIKGAFAMNDESYALYGKINNQHIVDAKLTNGYESYKCSLYHERGNIILELDKDLIDVIKFILILSGQIETAAIIENKIVMKPI